MTRDRASCELLHAGAEIRRASVSLPLPSPSRSGCADADSRHPPDSRQPPPARRSTRPSLSRAWSGPPRILNLKIGPRGFWDPHGPAGGRMATPTANASAVEFMPDVAEVVPPLPVTPVLSVSSSPSLPASPHSTQPNQTVRQSLQRLCAEQPAPVRLATTGGSRPGISAAQSAAGLANDGTVILSRPPRPPPTL